MRSNNREKPLNIDRKDLFPKKQQYGICTLCIIKDKYVIGACILAYIHKKLIKDLSYDLIIMCDKYIFSKYENLLSFYFHKIIQIDLIYVNKEPARGYLINKWQCLKLTEYQKILYLDVDILPISSKFYSIFTQNAPMFNKNESIALLKPDINIYDKIITSGSSEINNVYKKHIFNKKYNKYINESITSIKPWEKPTFIMWNTEFIWREIYEKMPKYDVLTKLFNETLLRGYNDFKQNSKNDKKYYIKIIKDYPKLLQLNKIEEIYYYEKKTKFENTNKLADILQN